MQWTDLFALSTFSGPYPLYVKEKPVRHGPFWPKKEYQLYLSDVLSPKCNAVYFLYIVPMVSEFYMFERQYLSRVFIQSTVVQLASDQPTKKAQFIVGHIVPYIGKLSICLAMQKLSFGTKNYSSKFFSYHENQVLFYAICGFVLQKCVSGKSKNSEHSWCVIYHR